MLYLGIAGIVWLDCSGNEGSKGQRSCKMELEYKESDCILGNGNQQSLSRGPTCFSDTSLCPGTLPAAQNSQYLPTLVTDSDNQTEA